MVLGPFPPLDGTGIYPVIEPPEPPVEGGDETPDENSTNAQIQAYADANGIDLGGATKKADMLAAIAASEKE